MKLNRKHTEFAKLLIEKDLTMEQIASRLGVSERTPYNWKKHPEIERLIDQFAKEAMRDARHLLSRHAKRAAQTLVFLLQIKVVQEGEATRSEFVHPPEVVRKAACDILQYAGVVVKREDQAPMTVRVVEETISCSEMEKRALKLAKRARQVKGHALART